MLFYFTKTIRGETRAFALISPYSAPNEHLLNASHNTLIVCRYQSEAILWVVEIRSILSVVAMIPFPFLINGHSDCYYMVEKIGLDVLDVDTRDDDENM